MPPSYRGADPEALYKNLEKRKGSSVKGEFETTADFNRRVAAEGKAPISGSLTKDSLIAIQVKEVTTLYNADNQEMGVTIKLSVPIVGVKPAPRLRTVRAKEELSPTETYIGTNAMGARTRVEKTRAWIYELIITNYASFTQGADKLSYNIKMDVPTAMRAKKTLGALAIIKLKEPYIREGFLSSKPTIADPNDVFAVYEYLNARLIELWVYDVETGQIWLKQPATAPDAPEAEYKDIREEQIEALKRQNEKLESLIKEQEKQANSLSELNNLAVASNRADNRRSQLRDVQSKEADLQARLEQIDFDLRPENLERTAQTYGSKLPAEAREERRRQLETERDRVQSQLKLLAESRTRLETAIAEADAEADRARGTLDGDTQVKPGDSKQTAGDAPIEMGALDDRVVKKPLPQYPATARAARITGVVIVHVVVDEQGKVISIQSSSGPALLRLAAETAARETVLKPVEVEGKPVKISGTLTFEFKL